jgi:hypothetical protein
VRPRSRGYPEDMRFLRIASTRRLLAVIAGLVALAVAGTAIAVAATSGGPVPRRASLAQAVHRALAGPSVPGVTADVTFTNNLIDSSDFAGHALDPLLQGASGRLWAGDGRLRIELQSQDGDAQIVVDHRSLWISDPAQNVVYRGTLPADHGASAGAGDGSGSVPSVARIRAALTRLMGTVDLSGAAPTDVAGRPAYRVTMSPTTTGGLIGSATLAWDAAHGIPLSFALYARGSSTPVLSLSATSISFGAVPESDFDVAPPAGARVQRLGTLGSVGGASGSRGAGHPSGPLPFTPDAPASLDGLPRHRVTRHGDGVLATYGHGPGRILVLETAHHGGAPAPAGGSVDGLSLPTVSLPGATGTELSTPLGTVIRFTRGGIDVTLAGSVTGATAEAAARGL